MYQPINANIIIISVDGIIVPRALLKFVTSKRYMQAHDLAIPLDNKNIPKVRHAMNENKNHLSI
jgi:hypothetical protein